MKRKTPLPAPGEAAKAVDSRSVYVRPFPMDATIDGVTSFFEGGVGGVNCVRFRRHARSKDFKGSVFIEFESEEVAKKVRAWFELGLNLGGSWFWKASVLQLLSVD